MVAAARMPDPNWLRRNSIQQFEPKDSSEKPIPGPVNPSFDALPFKPFWWPSFSREQFSQNV
jgi:hypothetical protein